MRFLIDTDVLVDLFHDQTYAKELIPDLLSKEPIYVSVITVAELRAGFTKQQAEFFIPKLYGLVTVLDLDRKIAELGGEFRFIYNKAITDMLIAATAVAKKCQLVTRNKKDFPMKEITFYPIEE